MLNRCALIVAATVLFGFQTVARAWDDFSSAEYRKGLDPAWGVSPPPGAVPVRPPRSTFGSFSLGVPIAMNVDRDFVRPGATLHAEGGLDLGYVGFFLHGGFRWFPVDFDRAADNGHTEYNGYGRDPLRNPHFGFGVKAQLPNRSRVMPYISTAFDFNFWHMYQTQTVCTGYWYWWCGNYDVYEFSPGFSGKVGSAVHIAGGFYVDIGLDISMSFEGKFFDRNEWWMEPFVGVLHRM